MKKLKGMNKLTAIVIGYHRNRNMSRNRVTRIQFNINGKELEKDLNYYSIFLRKGKKINVYYNSNKNIIDYVHGYVFILLLGILFIIGSLYLIIVL